jgi:hypothetical protein
MTKAEPKLNRSKDSDSKSEREIVSPQLHTLTQQDCQMLLEIQWKMVDDIQLWGRDQVVVEVLVAFRLLSLLHNF